MDILGRFIRIVTKPDGKQKSSVVEYSYDYQNRRVEKDIRVWDEDGDKTRTVERFAYNGQDIVLQTDKRGEVTHRYLHGPLVDQCLADESVFEDNEGNEAQNVLYPLSDSLGTIRDVVDLDALTGTTIVVAHFGYDAFGNRTSSTGTVDTIYGYTGRERDPESDLYYYRARYYDPHLTTFISQDPISFASLDTNLYRYVRNASTNATDPTGTFGGVGHHYFPLEELEFFIDILSEGAWKVGAGYYSGPTTPVHGWSKAHEIYIRKCDRISWTIATLWTLGSGDMAPIAPSARQSR